MATDLPQAAYKQQVHSGRNPDGTRHDGAGDPIMGLDRITTEDWEAGRLAGHLSFPYDDAGVRTFVPIRVYRTAEDHAAGVDRLVIFGEFLVVGVSSYLLQYRLGDAAAFTPFTLGGTDLTQWYGGTDYGTLELDISAIVNDWISVRLTVTGVVYVVDLGGWLESSTLPVI